MTKKAIIKLIADASRKMEKAHIAIKDRDKEFKVQNLEFILTRLTDSRVNASLAISRLENPHHE